MPKNTNGAEESAQPEQIKQIQQMTPEMLLSVIGTLQQSLIDSQQAQAKANEQLAHALLESRKPYEDPTKKANDELFKELDRKQRAREKANKEWSQNNCDHIAGGSNLSEQKDLYGRTSIVWHRGDVGQTTGVCTTCGRIFYQTDEDFAKWRSKRSFNKESRAGERYVADPVGAAAAARLG